MMLIKSLNDSKSLEIISKGSLSDYAITFDESGDMIKRLIKPGYSLIAGQCDDVRARIFHGRGGELTLAISNGTQAISLIVDNGTNRFTITNYPVVDGSEMEVYTASFDACVVEFLLALVEIFPEVDVVV